MDKTKRSKFWLNRRQAIQLAGGAVLWRSAKAMAGILPQQAPSIKSAVGGSGMLVGATIGSSEMNDPAKAAFVAQNFSMITPSTAMKWAYIHPQPNTFAWAYADSIVAFAKQRSLAVHGHNLCWNSANPAWVQQTVNRTNAQTILEHHIQTVVSQYKGKIDTWDVVNEPFQVGPGRPQGYMPGPWYNNLGSEYIDIAFHTAAGADSKAIRQLNIHKVEQDDKSCEATRGVALEVIRAAVKRGVPIQAVGIESHITTSLPVRSSQFVRFLKELVGMGLAVNITELDVDDAAVSGSLAQRLNTVGNYYAEYLDQFISATNTKRVGFWTLSDKNNWYDTTFPRKDGEHHHPGLLSDSFSPNPAYSMIETALKNASRH